MKTDAIPFDAPALAAEEAAATTRAVSKIYCENPGGTGNIAYCPQSRLAASGSVQSKVQALESLSGLGVGVTRRALGSGAYVWSVTFLDPGDDFTLAPAALGLDGAATALTGYEVRRAGAWLFCGVVV